MAKITKAEVLRYLKANGTFNKQEGDYWKFYAAGCSGITDFWLRDVPHMRFSQVWFNGGYDWRAYSDKHNGIPGFHICTFGVFEIIEAHKNGANVDEAYELAARKTIEGCVDYIRPGAPSDYPASK